MTRQEVFNTVVRGLAGQNWRQSRSHGLCVYRGDGGLKCAVGHLIPDDRYAPDLEGSYPLREVIQVAIPELEEHIPLLRKLQYLHDSFALTMEQWFRLYAEENNLEWPL